MTTDASRHRVRLKYRAHIEMGQSPPSTEYSSSSENGLPFLQGTADFGVASPTPRVYCRAPTKLARAGDILFSVRAPVGDLNLADQTFGIGRGLCAIRPQQHWDARFAWWALHEASHQLNFVSTGSTYDAVAAEDVGNLLVETTAPGAQRAIADYLDRETARLDTLVVAKERSIALLRERRAALIAAAVTGQIDVAQAAGGNHASTAGADGVRKVSWGATFPTEWTRKRIKYLCRFAGGGTPDKGNPEYWNGEIPWLSPKDMKSATINDTEDHVTTEGLDSSAAKLVAPGAVLLVMRSGILRHSIPVAINRVSIALNQDMRALIPIPQVEARFLARLLEAHQQQLLNVWSKVGSTVESLESDLVAETEIAVPALDQQHAIADYLDRETARLDTLVVTKERSITLLKERRAALIATAVTGQIDVTQAA